MLPGGAQILHKGWIILGIEPSASAQHIRDISRSFSIQRSLKADHQTLHNLVEDYN